MIASDPTLSLADCVEGGVPWRLLNMVAFASTTATKPLLLWPCRELFKTHIMDPLEAENDFAQAALSVLESSSV